MLPKNDKITPCSKMNLTLPFLKLQSGYCEYYSSRFQNILYLKLLISCNFNCIAENKVRKFRPPPTPEKRKSWIIIIPRDNVPDSEVTFYL